MKILYWIKPIKQLFKNKLNMEKEQGVPWGISESGYNMVDANLNYQYKAFGVPGTGFKRGLGEDFVISPYSTIMSLMVAPDDAYDNLQVLKEEGFEGEYGFYEAIDYTTSRLLRKQTKRCYQIIYGASPGYDVSCLFAYLLLNKPMQQRFEAEVQVKSALLLLQERIPRVTTFYSPGLHAEIRVSYSGTDYCLMRVHQYASYCYSGSSVIVKRKISCNGYQCRRGLQPVEKYCDYPLA